MNRYNPTDDPQVYEGTFDKDQIIENDEGVAFYIEGEWISVPRSTRMVIIHPKSFQPMLVVGKWLVPIEPLVDKLAVGD